MRRIWAKRARLWKNFYHLPGILEKCLFAIHKKSFVDSQMVAAVIQQFLANSNLVWSPSFPISNFFGFYYASTAIRGWLKDELDFWYFHL